MDVDYILGSDDEDTDYAMDPLDYMYSDDDEDTEIDEDEFEQLWKPTAGNAVNRLSHDILHYLFATCLHTIEDQPGLPVVLSHVSPAWRFTALRSPLLWTSIYMQCKRRHPRHAWVRVYLRRTKGLPLDFHIYTLRPLEQEELQIIINPNSHRFRTFRIVTTSDILLPIIFKELLVDFPILEEFEFRAQGGRDRARVVITRQPGLLIGDEPFRLPPVKNRNHEIMWADWQARCITFIAMDYMPHTVRPTLTDIYTIFDTNKFTLKVIEFRGFAPELPPDQEATDSTGYPPIALTQLDSLTISYLAPIHFLSLLCLFTAPNLTTLTMRDICRCSEEDTPIRFAAENLQFPASNDASALFSMLSITKSITHLNCFGVRCQDHICKEFVHGQMNLESAIIYDSVPYFFHALCTALPTLDIPLEDQGSFAGEYLTNVLITGTSALSITTFLNRRVHANLPMLEKLAFSVDCSLPEVPYGDKYGIGMLTFLVNGAELVNLLPTPKVRERYVPVEERSLVTFRIVDRRVWNWYSKVPLPDSVFDDSDDFFELL